MLTPVLANRIVVLDTETTGLNPQEGHRIIEIGCVELINRRITGNRYHVYLNPEREIDQGAVEVHGITNEALKDKPKFADILNDFVGFIDGSQLIIHNAPFDVSFINHEFSLLDNEKLCVLEDFCSVFDTLAFARKKHPGQRNSLDALCKRYSVVNSHRELHGALLDAEILADVFLLMTGGQASLLDEEEPVKDVLITNKNIIPLAHGRPPLVVFKCDDDGLSVHKEYLEIIKKLSGHCLWNQ